MTYYKKSKDQNRLYYLIRWIKPHAEVDIASRRISVDQDLFQDLSKCLLDPRLKKSIHNRIFALMNEFDYQLQNSFDALTFRPIDLDTRFNYFAGSDGNIYRQKAPGSAEKKKLNGWLHQKYVNKKYYDKYYRRVALVMKDNPNKKYYVHRLVAFAFGLLTKDQLQDPHNFPIGHDKDNSEDNRPSKLKRVTHHENQVADRIKNGTYDKRGGKKRESCQGLIDGLNIDDDSLDPLPF